MSLTFNITTTPVGAVNEGEYLRWNIQAVGTFDYGTRGRWLKGVLSGTNITGEDVTEAVGDLYPLSESVLFNPPTSYSWPPVFVALTAITADLFTEGVETLTATLYTWLDGDPESTTPVGTASVNINDISTTPPNRIFYATPAGLSPARRVTLQNLGSADLVVEAPNFSDFMTTAQPLYTGTNYTSPPWTIPPGETRKFGLRFLSNDYGQFNEYMLLKTNEAGIFTRFDLTVIGRSNRYYTISPSGFVGNTTLPGFNFTATYTLIPYIDEIESPYTEIDFQASMSGHPSWRVDRTGFNEVTVRFDPWRDRLSSGVYSSVLAIQPTDPQYYLTTATNFANYQPDYANNYNTATWISHFVEPDAIVGLRIDIVNGQRVLTIGVGSGADGSSPINQGYESWFTVDNLSPMEGRQSIPFAFWQTVYQIPFNRPTFNPKISPTRIQRGTPAPVNVLGGPPASFNNRTPVTISVRKRANTNDFWFAGYVANTWISTTGVLGASTSIALDVDGNLITSPVIWQNSGVATFEVTFPIRSEWTYLNGNVITQDIVVGSEATGVILTSGDSPTSGSGSSLYYSGDFRVKTQEPLARDYDYYFGHYDSFASMFVVSEDSDGNVFISVNDLREQSSDNLVNQTLDRLTRIFYYYSPNDAAHAPQGMTDVGPRDDFGRFNVNAHNTYLLRGFDSNNQPILSLVNLPR